MSSGYTPLFASLTTGTLCGLWPDIGLWPIVLALADRHGVVDCTPAYISGITGLGLQDVVACMKRFCEPDAYSRTSAEKGARLVLVDPDTRDWGWRIVNFLAYRERARLMAKNAAATASGADKARKAAARDSTDVRRIPPRAASKTETETETETETLNGGLKGDFSHSHKSSPSEGKRNFSVNGERPLKSPSPADARRNGDFERINADVLRLITEAGFETDDPSRIAQVLHISEAQAATSIRQLRDRGAIACN